MQLPISEVPRTSVKTCILPKIKCVAEKAVPTETKMETTDARIGRGLLNARKSITITSKRVTVEIRDISFTALFEL